MRNSFCSTQIRKPLEIIMQTRPMKKTHWLATAALLVTMLPMPSGSALGADNGAVAPAEALPAGTSVVKLAIEPTTVELKNRYQYAQLLVTAELNTGSRVDVTRIVQAEVPPGDIATVSSTGQVRPKNNGQVEIKFSLAGQSVSLPVIVSGHTDPYEVSFVRDVAPIMSKMGCNAGTCHGAAQGKNGFKLSLRGYDPLFDHQALTDDHAGRRFNRAAPDKSLMLLKPSGGAPHMGGVLTRPGEPYYDLLRSWIASGVKLDMSSTRVVSIDVFPKGPEIPLPGMKQQIRVLATYGDGSVRDVSAEAFLESSQTDILEISKQGLATALRRGEAAILARYEGAYAATTLVCMGDRSGFVWNDPPAFNPLDSLVYEKLKKVKVLTSDLCTDQEFVRRIYLDLTGVPPEPEVVRAFVADARDSKTKRDDMIDRLVGSPDYVDHWTNKWADLLQVNRKFLGEEGAWSFRNWIHQALSRNLPYDKFVYEILTASGSTLENPPSSYFKVLRAPGDAMENTTQLFLAVRFNCNKCHDHPFERWTQDQYYELAAYFAQVGRKPDPAYAGKLLEGTAVEGGLPLAEVIYDQRQGDVTHIRTGKVADPSFPYQKVSTSQTQVSRREQLARWVTATDNQYFTKSYVNRMWSYLLGAGIIEPIDDIRAGNPPSNPELLDYLTREFIANQYDVRWLITTICKSRTYQLSISTNPFNEDDQLNFSHGLARRLPAETLYDSLYRVTGSQINLPGVPSGFLASQLPDGSVDLTDGFFNLFGRPPRESACECERSSGVMLGQALNLVNGPTLASAIGDPNNRITKLVQQNPDDRQVLSELYMAILCRDPSQQEVDQLLGTIQETKNEAAVRAEALAIFERDELPKRLASWEASVSAPNWSVLEPRGMLSQGGATMTRKEDGSILLSGNSPLKDTYTIVGTAQSGRLTGIRLEILPDPSLPANGPGRAGNGNIVLGEFKVARSPLDDPTQSTPVKLTNAKADFSQPNLGPETSIDGNSAYGWAIDPEEGKPHMALFEFAEPIDATAGVVFTVTMEQVFGQQHTVGRFRLSLTASQTPFRLEGPPANVAEILAVAPDARTPEQKNALLTHYRTVDTEYDLLVQTVAADKADPNRYRLVWAQDVAWALLNNPAFLFNR